MTEPRQERKVVTVLFCDLVGFTSQAETMDPEDVAAILRPYHERVRAELERYGGTVEKFIGDAVMALFGAPVAHEDDPERAVRAALAIRDFALENEVELRVGITTGEALVQLDAQPDAGEGMASGDVVNTAARLQSAAPVNGVLVDGTTYRATRAAIDYDDAEAVDAKGKAEPIAVWQAISAHSRFGVDVAHEARTELVGRERELGVLRDAFERASDERVSQLVTLVGVPGVGKSRLVYELSRIADADPGLVTWRQGRCLAYGDGVTLWALAEIVKAQAGILEQDSPHAAGEKIHAVIDDVLGGSGDEAWVESHLRPLAGLEEKSELGGDRRNEAYAAWRRFLEGLAEQRALVLVFEDLHWADENLLDFVDELCEWVTDVPLLVVATARPELLERRPGWGGGKLNATTLALGPLDDEQTALLISRLLDRPLLTVEDQSALLERAGGNPLYAEQFADLFLERGATDELSLPETLQGIIAARVDALPPGEKGLLQDAAVVGKVFWANALPNGQDSIRTTLHALERKGFVRRQKRTSVEGQQELAFAHALVRDVSYGQIARGDRAAKHRHVAEWIEALGRPEDHAEMLAHHWRSALELGRAAGDDDGQLTERARRALRDAGDRALALNSYAVAATHFGDAVALWPADDADRPALLFARARALFYAYDEDREVALEEAHEALLETGSADLAGEALGLLAYVSWERGQGDLTRARFSQAEELIRDSFSPSAARVLATSSRMRVIAGERDEGLKIGEAAFAMAEQLGLSELQAHSLATIGMAKNYAGDPSGLEDMKRALAIAVEADAPVASSIANNLAVQSIVDGDLPGAREYYEEAFRLAERLGDRGNMRFVHANLIWLAYMQGQWDEAYRDAEAFIAECEAGSRHLQEVTCRNVRSMIWSGRGRLAEAVSDIDVALELSRARGDPVNVGSTISVAAALHAEHGDVSRARDLVEELLPIIHSTGMNGAVMLVAEVAEELGVVAALRVVVEEAPPPSAPRWRHACTLTLDGNLSDAADVLADMEAPTVEAEIRLRAGQRLLELGRDAEAEVELQKSLAFHRSVGASRLVAKGEELLARAQRASA